MFFMCMYIFLARMVDVSIGTVRTIMMVKGKKYIASVLAFFEVFVWFLVAKEALVNVSDSLWIAIAYSGGYASGTFVGSVVTNKFINSNIAIEATTSSNNNELINRLRSEGYGVSVVSLKKSKDEENRDLLFIKVRNKSLRKVIDLIKEYEPKSFIVTSETRYVQNGVVK